jgi:response regulator of citrate/malate metabolism
VISVLVVEDEEITAEANRLYVERVPGFEVVGVARSGGEALRFMRQRAVDLVLLDLYLPDMHGLEVCRTLRAAGLLCDVIAVTSARDLSVIRSAVSVGVVQYLLKPFTFAALAEKLRRYAEFRSSVEGAGEASGQGEVDRALATLRGTALSPLPKGMAQDTLESVAGELRKAPGGMSAQAAGAAVGVSRVTARRYLEYLIETGFARRLPQYGGVGRPELLYQAVPGRSLPGPAEPERRA